jgi:tRNA pseudouridine38-40 synthase
MRDVARVFLGRRDFAAMQNVGTQLAHTVRTVESVRLDSGQRPEETVVTVAADGFLKQMVRIMVGCLVRAGKHKLSPGELEAILDSRDRSRASATAPAKGLCLEQVVY